MVDDAMSLSAVTEELFHHPVSFLVCRVTDGSFVSMEKSLKEEGITNGSFLLLY